MKRRDLDALLKKAGYRIYDNNPHDKAIHPDYPSRKIAIPKHKEIDERLARAILKQAGIGG